jgi:hypothetical protein
MSKLNTRNEGQKRDPSVVKVSHLVDRLGNSESKLHQCIDHMNVGQPQQTVLRCNENDLALVEASGETAK